MRLLSICGMILCLMSIGSSDLVSQVRARLPKLETGPGAEVAIPLEIGDLTGKSVTSFELVISCDTNFVRLKSVQQANTLTHGMLVFANNNVRPYNEGRMKVVGATAKPLSGSGPFLKIIAVALGREGGCELRLESIMLNTGSPKVEVTQGFVKVRRQSKKGK